MGAGITSADFQMRGTYPSRAQALNIAATGSLIRGAVGTNLLLPLCPALCHPAAPLCHTPSVAHARLLVQHRRMNVLQTSDSASTSRYPK